MTINEDTLDQARHDWGLGILKISEAYENSGIDKARVVANEFLDNLYGFEFGPILFKPTLSGEVKRFDQVKKVHFHTLLVKIQIFQMIQVLELSIGEK